jgi:hypothetical protein
MEWKAYDALRGSDAEDTDALEWVSEAYDTWCEVSSSSSAAAPARSSGADEWEEHFSIDAVEPTGSKQSNTSDAFSGPRQHLWVSEAYDTWDAVSSSSSAAAPARFDPRAEALPPFTQYQQQSQPQPREQRQPQVVLRGSDGEDTDALKIVAVPDAQQQHQQQQHLLVSEAYDTWAEVSSSSSAAAPVQSSGAEVLAPAPARRPGARVRFLSGANVTRRISDQKNRDRKKLLGEAWAPSPVGRRAEQFDKPHINKRQNWADTQEGLAISKEILDPQWQARVITHAQTRKGQKQMGPLADALNMSKTANTMINNCNEILKGRPQAAVTFAPDELKRLYPEDVVGKFTLAQCVENLGRLGVRAPENTLDSMRTTLGRIGGTGSIAGEAGVRAGAKHRAELTGKLTQGITAREASKLLPNVTSKYITAAKARENDTAFVSTLGENYASNTTREKISSAQANLYVNFFKSITDFKSGSGAHTKSRILTKQRHEVIIDLFANFPKLLRQWAVENATEMEQINGTLAELRSKFEADVVAAASHKEYDLSSTEHDIREMMAKQEYQSRLRKNAQAQRKFTKVQPSSKGSSQSTQTRLEELIKKPDAPPYLQESAPGQNPCSEEVFWRILTDNKIKFTTTVRPTNCPIHETGPSYERALKEALLDEQVLEAEFNRTTGLLDDRKRLLDAHRPQEEGRQNDADEADLRACTEAVNQAKSELLKVGQKKLRLQKQVALYHKHLAQYETSRAEVKKIMENLGPDECLVYRDFVNQHSWYDNTKVCNLILVLIWKEDGQLYSVKLNNFCSDEDSCSTDPYYVRDVFDFHMKPKSVQLGHTGLLSRFKKIYISGRVSTKPHLHLTLS